MHCLQYLKALSYKGNAKFDPIHLFISGVAGTGKSYLVKILYQAVSKEFLYQEKDPEKTHVLLLGPIEISVVKVHGAATHAALGIKPNTKFIGLSDKIKANLKNKLSETKRIIIYKMSMFSSDLFSKIYGRLN